MSEYSTWMSDKWNIIKGRPLSQIALPGTHNSGVFSPDNTVGVRNQDVNIGVQLENGIRVFDIRVTIWKNEFYMHHSGICANGQELSKALEQLKDFARNNPKEKAIIQLAPGAGSNLKDSDKTRLRKKVEDELGEFQIPEAEAGLPIENQSGSLAVLSYVGPFGKSWDGNRYYSSSWQHWQSDCGPTPAWKIEHLKPHLEMWLKAQGQVCQINLNEASCLIWAISIWDAAHWVNNKFTDWAQEWKKKPDLMAGANIFLFDFFQVGDVVSRVIDFNDAKPEALPAPNLGRLQQTARHSMPQFTRSDSFDLTIARAHLRKVGLNWADLEESYGRLGRLTDDVFEKLDAFGIPPPVVREFVAWYHAHGR